MNLNVVLVEPEIPQNTGNISRTCVLTNCTLHLVGPLGFSRYFYSSTHGTVRYTDIQYRQGDFIVFGKETAGLPKDLLRKNEGRVIRIPMVKESTRSLNLSNSVAIVAYEALRQIGFPDMR